MRLTGIQSALGFLLRHSITVPGFSFQTRWSSKLAHPPSAPAPALLVPDVPAPIPLVPDVESFFKVIGRGLKQHAPKFPTWEALFSLTPNQLRELGIEPARTRRYLLRWRQRFRQGKFGPGGDLKYVDDGVAELKILKPEVDDPDRMKHVVNFPLGKNIEEIPPEELVRPAGYKVKRSASIVGPYALPVRGGARITVTEGMWEDKRGHKVDKGERRQAEVRFKRRVAERKALREKQGFY
jgi:hypothetical protein